VVNFEIEKNVPMCGKITNIHRIVVWKGWIFDGLNKFLLPVTQENLDWCCGDGQVFTGMFEAFTFIPGKRLQKTITSKLH
jgi:hypothetical protein